MPRFYAYVNTSETYTERHQYKVLVPQAVDEDDARNRAIDLFTSSDPGDFEDTTDDAFPYGNDREGEGQEEYIDHLEEIEIMVED